MSTNLGNGGSLASVTLTPSFARGNASASLIIPDSLFPDVKGGLRYSSGPNPNAKILGSTAMGATATGVIKGANFVVGFKQVATFKFDTAFYAGIKDSDGSIEVTSTGLNFRNFIDCAADQNLQAPQAPFYLPRAVAPNGTPFNISMVDQPGGRIRLQRRNSLRDRLNFLVAFSTSCEFLTFVVVEKLDSSHLPIQGFRWSYTQDIAVAWTRGQPSIESNSGSAKFISNIDSLPAGDPRQTILTNTALKTADTLVFQFNRAMFAAQSGHKNADFATNEFPNYSDNISSDMRRRVETSPV